MYAAMLQTISRSCMENMAVKPDIVIRQLITEHSQACITNIDKVLMESVTTTFIAKPTILGATYDIDIRAVDVPESAITEFILTHPAVKDLERQLKSKFSGCGVSVRVSKGILCFGVAVRLVP